MNKEKWPEGFDVEILGHYRVKVSDNPFKKGTVAIMADVDDLSNWVELRIYPHHSWTGTAQELQAEWEKCE